jgi:hypothetical protein
MRIVAVAGQRKDRTTQSARLVRQFCESFDQAYDQDRHLASLPPDANLYVQYGFKRNGSLDAAMEKNIPFVILDRGYFNNRGKCFSVSINGFHGLSMQVPEVWNRPTREHPLILPRQEPGEFVYLYGQMQGDRALRGLTVETWLRKEAPVASDATGKPCKIRPHPMTISSWEPQLPPLASTFEESFCAVSWTSTASVLAAIAGVETVAMHPANPAYPVSAHSYQEIGSKRLLSRQQWLHDLSYRNYKLDEIKQANEYVRFAYKQARDEALVGLYDTIGLRP